MAHTLLQGDKIDWVDMDMADNGIIVQYTIKRKSQSKGEFDNTDHINKKVLFMDDKLDEAFALFKELMMAKRTQFLEKKGLSPSVTVVVQEAPAVA